MSNSIRQQLLVALGLLIACVVMYHISGGFPPLTWQVWFVSLTCFHALYAVQGTGFVFRFLLLLIQSLLVGLGWWLLLSLLIREGRALSHLLHGGQLQDTPLPSPSQTGTTTPPVTQRIVPQQQVLLENNSYLSSSVDSQSSKKEQYDPPVVYPFTDLVEEMLDDPPVDDTMRPEDLLQNPFEDEDVPSLRQRRSRPRWMEEVDEWQSPKPSLENEEPEVDEWQPSQSVQESEQQQTAEPSNEDQEWLLFQAQSEQKQSENTEWPWYDEEPFKEHQEQNVIKQEFTNIETLPVDAERAENQPAIPGNEQEADDELDERVISLSLKTFTRPNKQNDELIFHAVSHPGIKRAQKPNEDSHLELMVTRTLPYHADTHAGLFLVADGMGGSTHGQYASSSVIETIRADLEPLLIDSQLPSDQFKEKLHLSVMHANELLYQENADDKVFRGTTITGAILLEQQASTAAAFTTSTATYIAHVINIGDSRTYWHSVKHGFSRVTRDHSVVEILVSSGEITPEERYSDRRRNQIYRCLGDSPSVDVDVFTLELQAGDRLLFCSDGLWELVRDEQLMAILGSPTLNLEELTQQFLAAALAGGGSDNITAVVVQIPI